MHKNLFNYDYSATFKNSNVLRRFKHPSTASTFFWKVKKDLDSNYKYIVMTTHVGLSAEEGKML